MRNCKGQMSKSEIMTILLCYHFGSFRNFKHYLTERKRICLYTYAESDDPLQRNKFKSLDSEKLCN